jgi:hypothetical protein
MQYILDVFLKIFSHKLLKMHKCSLLWVFCFFEYFILFD